MTFVSSDKLTVKEIREDCRCKKCDAQLYLVRRILDPLSGKTIRMFECKCGKPYLERISYPRRLNGPRLSCYFYPSVIL